MQSRVTIAVAFVMIGLAVVPASAKSPGRESFGNLIIGPGSGAVLIFNWQINDAGPSTRFPNATGVAGPEGDANGYVSGWSLLYSVLTEFGHGNMTWTATSAPGSQFQMSLETLLGPTTFVGQNPDGLMTSFDPDLRYAWPCVKWDGTYTGPPTDATLNADTVIDATAFANGYNGTFALHFDGSNKSIDLVYTPVPEPSSLALLGFAGITLARLRRRRPLAI